MTLRKTLGTAVTAASLVLTIGCANDDAESTQEDQAQPGEEAADHGSDTTEASGEQFTMAEVEDNSSPESCWTVIEDHVYDVTDWIDQHPGGPSRIEQLCGTDGTQMFTGQHSADAQPQDQLAEFQIGELAD